MGAIQCDDKAMYITSVVLCYWFISISMVYLNKVRTRKTVRALIAEPAGNERRSIYSISYHATPP
jgi:hypothetical protein